MVLYVIKKNTKSDTERSELGRRRILFEDGEIFG